MENNIKENWKFEANESDTLLVTFSSHRAKNLQIFPVLQGINLNQLWLSDPSDNWYNTGINTFSSSISETSKRIESIAHSCGATKIKTIGSSMGGYGAILFGCQIGATNIAAFGPQTILNSKYYLSPRNNCNIHYPDLIQAIKNSTGGEITITYGSDDIVDEFNSGRISNLDNVKVFTLKNEWHTFTQRLAKNKRLSTVANSMLWGDQPPDTEPTPSLEHETRSYIKNAVEGYFDKSYKEAEFATRLLIEIFPQWAAPHFWLGRILSKTGQHFSAAAHFKDAQSKNLKWTEPQRHYGKALLDAKEYTHAEKELRISIANDPWSSWGYVYLAEALVMQGLNDEISELLLAAEKIDPITIASAKKIRELIRT